MGGLHPLAECRRWLNWRKWRPLQFEIYRVKDAIGYLNKGMLF